MGLKSGKSKEIELAQWKKGQSVKSCSLYNMPIKHVNPMILKIGRNICPEILKKLIREREESLIFMKYLNHTFAEPAPLS